MAKDNTFAGYARFATRSQADPETEKKLETIKLLQEIGYYVAVAPDDFDGDQKKLQTLPLITGQAPDDGVRDQVRSLIRGDKMLVICGKAVHYA